MLNITIINGPNLNLLGKREPGMYGNESFDDCLLQLKEAFPQVNFTYFQSNVEGEIVSAIQQYGFNQDGIILNPAAYTHTSIAIGDAVAAIKTPVIEVHISNVHAREDFRKISHVSAKSVGSIVGLGLKGYALATEWFIAKASAIQ
jgi:3-dehydroquinate dehydratase II